jgi:hypothetical protein
VHVIINCTHTKSEVLIVRRSKKGDRVLHSAVMHLDTQLLATISIDGVVAFCIAKLNVSRCLYIE